MTWIIKFYWLKTIVWYQRLFCYKIHYTHIFKALRVNWFVSPTNRHTIRRMKQWWLNLLSIKFGLICIRYTAVVVVGFFFFTLPNFHTFFIQFLSSSLYIWFELRKFEIGGNESATNNMNTYSHNNNDHTNWNKWNWIIYQGLRFRSHNVMYILFEFTKQKNSIFVVFFSRNFNIKSTSKMTNWND